MKRTATMILLVMAMAGCASYRYDHVDYQADGKTPAAEFHVTIWKNGMDTSVAGADLTLGDGTRVVLTQATSNPNQGVVGAVKSIGDVLLGVTGVVLKFLGW